MNTPDYPTHRYVGTTDEATECDLCHRTELKLTVILELLDADGNVEERVNYGTSCAAKVLRARTGTRLTTTAVLNGATNAEFVRRTADVDARRTLAHYGLPLQGEPTPEQLTAATALYAHNHRMAQWAGEDTDWRGMVHHMVTRRQAQVIV
jgi:hypothetical protein